MKLELNGLCVACVIGDRPEERTAPQTLVVDVSLECGACKAVSSDLLVDTLDYVAVAEAIRRTLVAGRYRMIERAAGAIAETCRRWPAVGGGVVRVAKSGTVEGLASAAVVLEF